MVTFKNKTIIDSKGKTIFSEIQLLQEKKI